MLDGYYDPQTTDILIAQDLPQDAARPLPKDRARPRQADPVRAVMMLNFYAGLYLSSRMLGLR